MAWFIFHFDLLLFFGIIFWFSSYVHFTYICILYMTCMCFCFERKRMENVGNCRTIDRQYNIKKGQKSRETASEWKQGSMKKEGIEMVQQETAWLWAWVLVIALLYTFLFHHNNIMLSGVHIYWMMLVGFDSIIVLMIRVYVMCVDAYVCAHVTGRQWCTLIHILCIYTHIRVYIVQHDAYWRSRRQKRRKANTIYIYIWSLYIWFSVNIKEFWHQWFF